MQGSETGMAKVPLNSRYSSRTILGGQKAWRSLGTNASFVYVYGQVCNRSSYNIDDVEVYGFNSFVVQSHVSTSDFLTAKKDSSVSLPQLDWVFAASTYSVGNPSLSRSYSFSIAST